MPAKRMLWLVAIGLAIGNASGARAQVASPLETTSEPPPVAWREQSALRDIFFLNHDLGWAVGDQGTILRTEDGGRSWNLSLTSQSCSLRSVHFVDELNGWAAGGHPVPMVDRTIGVILRTRDGGKTWLPIDGTLLPAIRELRMTSENRGWAWGEPTQHFPSGIFLTEDGGRSWSDYPQQTPSRWTAVAPVQDGFAVATEQGPLAIYHVGEFRPSQQPAGHSPIQKFAFFGPQCGWALGEREILSTDDGAQSWQRLEIPSETLASNRFELTTAAEAGGKRWAAGSPGTYVFCHDLQSKQWTRARTPIRGPIHRLFFVDPDHGWAAGDWGNILVTRDGGKTWQLQRSGANRIGLLVICPSADSIPLDVLARFSADQGYLTAVALLDADVPCGDGQLRVLEACQRQGVVSIVLGKARADDEQTNWLLGLIRQMQPSAIIVVKSESSLPSAGGKAATDLAGLVIAATTQAANPSRDREWINQTALAPWQTPFLFQARAAASDNAWGSQEFLPSLGRNIIDQQLISKAILTRPVPGAMGVELIGLSDRSASTTTNLFEGITQGPLAPPRRPAQNPRGHVGQVKTIINKGTTFHQWTTQFDSSPESLRVWWQRVERLLVELSPEVAANWLWQLSEGYWKVNQLELAALSRIALLERFGDHPLAMESRMWLASYYASEELSWREFLQQRRWAESRDIRTDPAVKPAGLRAVPQKTEINGITRFVWTVETPDESQPAGDPRAEIQGQPSSAAATDFDSFSAQRLAVARNLLRSIQERDGEMMADPQVQFAECLIKRRTVGPADAEAALKKIPSGQLPLVQRQAISREIRLNGSAAWDETGDVIDCGPAASRPFLDGVLDDEIWRAAAESDQIIRLTPDASPSNGAGLGFEGNARSANDPELGQTQLMLAHDDEFLYIAAICHCASGEESIPGSQTRKRQRDRALDPRDQLRIAIDVDRDCRTSYLLTIDGRGSFADQLGENLLWNPTWYLAHARTDSNWMVEAAIPLEELGPPPDESADSAWGISICRQRPDGASERWSASPANLDKPRLMFALNKPGFAPPDGIIRFR